MNKKFISSFLLIQLISISFLILDIHSFINENESIKIHQLDFTLNFNSTNAYDHIKTQLDFGFRVPGTEAHVNCANWISNTLYSSINTVEIHNFEIQKSGQPSYNCRNILGKLNTDEKEIVILAAHWDSRNAAEKDSVNQTLPIPGANDGGSGVGVLLELARILSLYENNLKSQFWFLFIDAEDQGLSRQIYGLQDWDWAEGSKEFANNIDDFYDSSKESFECFILLDMVGGTNLEFVKEVHSDEDLHNSIFNEGRNLGYTQAFPTDPEIKSIIDDHIAFYELGIPVIDLIIDFNSGEWLYHHTHSDDLSHIDQNSLNITGSTVESFIKRYYTTGTEESWTIEEEHTQLKIGVVIFSLSILGCISILLRKKLYTRYKKNSFR